MKIKRQDVPFTMVANEVLCRTDISLKAKGLFAYLFSKPDGWDFAGERIAWEMKESRKSVLTALKELENSELLSRKKQPNGRVVYVLKYSSQSPESGLWLDDPKSQKGTVPKGHGAKRGPISNKDSKSNKDSEINKKDSSAPPSESPSSFEGKTREWSSEDLGAYLDVMQCSSRRDVRLVASYWGYKGVGTSQGGVQLRSKAEAEFALRRSLRAASRLVKAFSDERVDDVLAIYGEHARFDWTLENIEKDITKPQKDVIRKLQDLAKKK